MIRRTLAVLAVILGLAVPTLAQAQANLNPGDVAFTGLLYNGSSEFSFVSTTTLAAGQVIYFTNQGYDATIPGLAPPVNIATTAANAVVSDGVNTAQSGVVTIAAAVAIAESTISYTATAGLAPYTEVVIANTGNDTNQLQSGATSGALVFNHNGVGHKILAFTVNGAGVTQYVGAVMFGPDTWQTSGPIGSEVVSGTTYPFYWDSYLPPGLDSTTSTDMSAIWNADNLNQFDNANVNQNTILTCVSQSLASIVNPSNWIADGNVPKYSSSSKGFGLVKDETGGSPNDLCTGGSQVGWVPSGTFAGITGSPTPSFTPTNTFTPSGPTATFTNTPALTYTFTNTPTITPTPTNTFSPTNTATQIPLTPGAVGLIGMVRNGNSQVAFTSLSTLAAGTKLYFTNYSYDANSNTLLDESVTLGDGATTVQEGIVSYTVGSGGLAALNPVIFGTNIAQQLQSGTMANVVGAAGNAYLVMNHNGYGDKVLCFQVHGASVTQDLGAMIFGPDSWSGYGGSDPATFFDSDLPPGLSGSNSIDLSTFWNSNSAISGAGTGGNQNAVLGTCVSTLPNIVNPMNWVGSVEPKGNFGMPNLNMTACTAGTVGFTASSNGTATPINNAPTNTPTPTPILTNTFTPTVTSTATPRAVGAGGIAFTALLTNGSSEFSFVAPSGLDAGTVLYFTDDSYDATINSGAGGLVAFATPDSRASGQGVTEGIISYTVPTGGLAAYAPVVISKTSNDANKLQGGTLANVAGNAGNTYLNLNHNGEGAKLLAYTVDASGNTHYAAALLFGPDTWQTTGAVANWWDTYMPPGLSSTSSTNLSTAWNSNNLGSLFAQGNDNAILNSCQNTLAGIVNPTNWAVDANVPTGSLFLDNVSSPLTVCGAGQAGWTGTVPASAYLTNTPTNSPTNSPTNTPTNSPTNSPTPTITDTPDSVQLTATQVETYVVATATAVENKDDATATEVAVKVIATATAAEVKLDATATEVENKVVATATAGEVKLDATATQIANNSNNLENLEVAKQTATVGAFQAAFTATAAIELTKPTATQTAFAVKEVATESQLSTSANATATQVYINVNSTATMEAGLQQAAEALASAKQTATPAFEANVQATAEAVEGAKETATPANQMNIEATQEAVEGAKETATPAEEQVKETATQTGIQIHQTATATAMIAQATETATAQIKQSATATALQAKETGTPTKTPTPGGAAAPAIGGLVENGNGHSITHGNAILAPVPVVSGQNLCLYNAEVASSIWQVFSLMGERVADLSLSGGNECWNTTGFAPGLYLIQVNLTYLDGTTAMVKQKVVIIK